MALTLFMLLGPLSGGSYAAVVIQGVTPSSPSPRPVGTTVTWTVSATGAQPESLDYQFSVKTPTAGFVVVRDFSPSASFEWTPTEREGDYEIRVVARDTTTQETAQQTAAYAVSSRVAGDSPVISPTAHPLVALYSAPACEAGRMRVRFSPSADASAMQATHWKPCRPGASMNFYVAGMRANTAYSVRHEVSPDAPSPRTFGPPMSFTTGGLPPGGFPVYTVPDPPDDAGLGLVLHGPFPPYLLRATDLSGNVLWYYDKPLNFFTRPLPGGTMLVTQDTKEFTDTLSEVDLAGNTLRQTNIYRVSEQLVAGGGQPVTSFHHEATRLPDGKLLVLCTNERVMTGVQSAGTDYIIGDVIVVLDENLQVVWSWDAFDHMDVRRKAVGDGARCPKGPFCVTSSPDGVGNDWLHSNSVAYSPADGNLIVSVRHQDWVIKIDYADGAGAGGVLWRLGRDGDFTINSADPYPWFSHQHDVEYDGGGAGRMSLFDNGNARQGLSTPATKNSRGQVYDLDEANRTATLYMNTDLGGYAFALGSAQRLAGGGYHFLSGWLPGNRSQSIGVGEGGPVNYRLESDTLVYRSFRMRDLYTLDSDGPDFVREDQAIDFAPLADRTFGDAPVALSATATSELPVGFLVVSGPAAVSGDALDITGAGEVSVRARQPGNGYYNAAQPVERSFKVAKAAARVALSDLNQTYDGKAKAPTFTTDPAGLSVSLTYSRNGLTVASPTAAGSYDVAAAVDDPNHEGVAAGTLVIAKAGQTIDFAQPPGKTFGDAPFELSAAASSELPVSFRLVSGPATLEGRTLTVGGAGVLTVTASQAGDQNFEAAEPVERSFTVAKADQTVTFAALPDKTFGDADFSVSAAASSALSVSFAASGDCTVSGSTVRVTGAGSCTVTASQAGDADHNAAPDVSRTFAVAKAAQAITFAALPDRTFGDADFAVAAAAGSGLKVSFAAAGRCVVSVALAVHITGAGICTVTASQAGGPDHNAAPDVQRSFRIEKAATAATVSSSSDGPARLGRPVTFDAVVTSVAVTPSGAVAFKLNGAAIDGCENEPLFAGRAACTTSALPLGVHALTAEYSGDSDFLHSSATLSGGQTVAGDFEFSQARYTVAERGGRITVTVGRGGDISLAAEVDYSTGGGTPAVAAPCPSAAGLALERCDYTRAAGTLRFAAGEEQKSFTVLVNDDSFVEGAETARLRLSNPTAGATLGAVSDATLEITDDAQESSANPLDDEEAFVRQHYHDFLNREPDAEGLKFWSDAVKACGADRLCREANRINISAAFFLSIEFQQTGYLVERVYKVAYGDAAGVSTSGGPHQSGVPAVRLPEFLPDAQEVREGVIVGEADWGRRLEANKRAFLLRFVRRARFAQTHALAPTQYVDLLNSNAGGVVTDSDERIGLINEAAAGTDEARASVLRKIAEHPELDRRERNRAFVLMQYFGYLRRDPDDTPDADHTGYDFWLGKLEGFGGDFVRAEMVGAFINSQEYRQRFAR